MQIYYLTTDEIKKLKKDLMSKRSKSYSYYGKRKNNKDNLAKSFSESYKQSRNSEIGHIFEDNIRQTLNVEYHWTNALAKRQFFFSEVLQ